jgi:hypothetical protein
MEMKLQKKEIKINKFAKNHDEEIKNRLERLNMTKEKWTTRIDTHQNHLKTTENTWFKQGREKQMEILQYLENKRKRDLLKHSESMQTSMIQGGEGGAPNATI